MRIIKIKEKSVNKMYGIAEQIAEAAGSFNYEFVCGISRRVCRRYTAGGQVILEVDFLLD